MTDEVSAGPGDVAERASTLRKSYYVKLAGAAVKFGCSISDARTIAEDALTELVLLEHRGAAGAIRDELAWLYGTVRNMALAARRKAGRDAGVDAHEVADRTRQVTWSSPEQHLDAVETLRAVQALPEDHRVAVVLASEGYSVKEVADTLGISVAAAKQRISRGRRTLRVRLGEGRHGDDR